MDRCPVRNQGSKLQILQVLEGEELISLLSDDEDCFTNPVQNYQRKQISSQLSTHSKSYSATLGNAIELKLSQSSNSIPIIQPPKSLKSKQPVKVESPVNFKKALTRISRAGIRSVQNRFPNRIEPVN